MIKLSISIFSLDGGLEILMRHFKIFFIQSNITSVKVVIGTGVVLFNGIFILFESSAHITLMIKGQTQVLMVKREVIS